MADSATSLLNRKSVHRERDFKSVRKIFVRDGRIRTPQTTPRRRFPALAWIGHGQTQEVHMDIVSKADRRSSRVAKGTLMVLAAGLSMACSGAEGGGGTEESTPVTQSAARTPEAAAHVYSVDLGDEHKLTYSLFHDGAMVVSEVGRFGKHKPVGESVIGLSPAEAFRSLRPGAAVPRDLAESEGLFARPIRESADEASAAEPAVPFVQQLAAGSPAAGLLPKDITSDPNSFFGIFGCFFGSGDVLSACLPNRGDWANVPGSSRWAIYKVAPYIGTVTVNISIAGVLRSVYPVSQGQFNFNWARGGLVKHWKDVGTWNPKYKTYPNVVAHQYQLTDAAGDQFHLSVRLHNYQTEYASCAEVMSSDTTTWIRSDGVALPCTNHYGGT
jgi:hypothetical protein